MQYRETIRRGATFYREVVLFRPKDPALPFHPVTNSEVVDPTGMTPRAVLLRPSGAHVADFSCALLEPTGENPAAPGYLPRRVALTMSRAATSALVPGTPYLANLDMDQADGVTTEPGPSWRITVEPGEARS